MATTSFLDGMQQIISGKDAWRVSKAMGHSDLKMTENYVAMAAKDLEDHYGRSHVKIMSNVNGEDGK